MLSLKTAQNPGKNQDAFMKVPKQFQVSNFGISAY